MAKHKCKVPPPPVDTTRWLGTYGDMVTLLMAFFVMLFAVSETNVQKFEAFVSGLAGPFDNPAVELGLVTGATLEDSSPNVIQTIVPMGAQASHISNHADAGAQQVAAQQAAVEQQLAEVEQQLESALSDIELPISADIRDDERGLVVSISTDDVLFETGSAQLSDAGVMLLAEIGPVLAAAPNTVVVEGHTDDVPLNAGGYSNWNLSTDRAVAVVERLGEVHDLPFGRLSATGYAEHRALVPNDSAENRAVNRRVEILIVGMSPAEPAPPPSSPEAPALPGAAMSLPPMEGEGSVDFSEPLPGSVSAEPPSIAGILGASPP